MGSRFPTSSSTLWKDSTKLTVLGPKTCQDSLLEGACQLENKSPRHNLWGREDWVSKDSFSTPREGSSKGRERCLALFPREPPPQKIILPLGQRKQKPSVGPQLLSREGRFAIRYCMKGDTRFRKGAREPGTQHMPMAGRARCSGMQPQAPSNTPPSLVAPPPQESLFPLSFPPSLACAPRSARSHSRTLTVWTLKSALSWIRGRK